MATVDIKELENLLKKILKTNTIETNKEKRQLRVSRSRKGSMITTDNIVADFKRLSTEIDHNIKTMKEHSGFAEQFVKGIKEMFVPAASLGKTFKESAKQLREYIKHENDNFKKISMGTFNVFQELVMSGKKYGDQIDKIVKLQDGLNQVLKESDSVYRKNLAAQKLQKDLLDLSKEKAKILKNGPGQNTSRLFDIEKERKGLQLKLNGLTRSISDYKFKYDGFVRNIDELQKDNIQVLTNFNTNDLQFNEIFKRGNKKRKPLLDEMQNNIMAINKGLVGFESATFNYSNEHKAASKRFKDSSKAFLAALAVGAATRGISDYQATRKYNVGTISPFQAGNMGMSQAELSTLIGENKEVLRMLGKGNQNAFIDSGDFKDLQNGAKMFGLAGKDAADLVGKIGRLQMESGQVISKQSIQFQMETMKKLTDTTNMTVDELIDFQSELNKSGFISTMTVSLFNKSEKERQELMADEIDKRYKLNKSLGISNEQMKQRIQMETNSKYKDLTTFIKQQIGGEIASDKYEELTGKKLSSEEKRLFSMEASGNLTLSANDPRKKMAMQQVQEFQTVLHKTLTEGSMKAANSGNIDSLAQSMIERQILSTFGVTAIDQDSIESATNNNRLSKQINDSIFGKNANKNINQVNVNDIGRAEDNLTKGFNALGSVTVDLKEKFEGLAKSLVGGGIAAGVNLTASVINLIAAGKGLTRFLGTGGMLTNTLQTFTSGVTSASKSISGMVANSTILNKLLSTALPKVLSRTGAIAGAALEAGFAFKDAAENSKTSIGLSGNFATNLSENILDMVTGGGLGKGIRDNFFDPLASIRQDISRLDSDAMQKRQYDYAVESRIALMNQDPKKYGLGNLPNDTGILNILNSSRYASDAKLKDLGASDNVMQMIKQSQMNYMEEFLNPDNVMDGSNNDAILEKLEEISKNTGGTTSILVEDSKKRDLQDASKPQIEKLIADFTKNTLQHFDESKSFIP